MRDLITAFSGLIALAIFLYSMIVGADLEPTLWKTLIIFVCSNLIGYSAHGITSVTINSDFGDSNASERRS